MLEHERKNYAGHSGSVECSTHAWRSQTRSLYSERKNPVVCTSLFRQHICRSPGSHGHVDQLRECG